MFGRGKSLGTEETVLQPVSWQQRLLLTFLIAAAYADGELSVEEGVEIDALLYRTPTLFKLVRTLPSQSVDALVNEVEAEIKAASDGLNGPIEQLRAMCAATPPPKPFALSIFAHCTDILFADQKFVSDEIQFLKDIGDLLGLPEKDRIDIYSVLAMKNRH